mmetsp:Transcript_109114/g.315242  ORF Transcript_109114/g.315242 Transcript_109114/m.315242 type:complete len:305 (+) Transcript_109114:83-997(+)
MLRLLALASTLPFFVSGARVGAAGRLEQAMPVVLEAFYGVPKLEVMFSSSVAHTVAALARWSTERDFGLFVRAEHTQEPKFFPVRVVTLGICRGNRVLIMDLRPLLGRIPAPLPRPITEWLEHPNRTFYGMDLRRGAGRMAFEFDCVLRAVDYSVRSWPELRRGAGLYDAFKGHVSDVDLWRPDSLQTLSGQARHAYIQWAVAQHFMTLRGRADEEWVITEAELFEAGPVYLRVAQPRHDWTRAKALWQTRHRSRKLSLLDWSRAWRRQARGAIAATKGRRQDGLASLHGFGATAHRPQGFVPS